MNVRSSAMFPGDDAGRPAGTAIWARMMLFAGADGGDGDAAAVPVMICTCAVARAVAVVDDVRDHDVDPRVRRVGGRNRQGAGCVRVDR